MASLVKMHNVVIDILLDGIKYDFRDQLMQLARYSNNPNPVARALLSKFYLKA